jgi:NADH:ubiquinone oxidoreductase subunit 6 (subunit J)
VSWSLWRLGRGVRLQVYSASVDALSVVLIVAAIVFAILAVRLREILYAAIALGLLSVIIAAMFFKLNSPYAGVFELSVCAGLVTALFVSVISLTGRK